jgi:hypothetical protein
MDLINCKYDEIIVFDPLTRYKGTILRATIDFLR